ncbi:MAG: o-succinylbenzoate--CoA ligase [Candidatus Viridilinea halotolerans]|uniref:2-succinylbenzoate--CoA ligase n=1 Tax=Candidatus Viridilinea halotolerans TaxID=2491704 RepID=A0A426TQL6_9CHLR|nr:MAG: o-succinylbenzoate--CoA ligase [Candidatus Viridilinea halotolerans]
MDLPDWLARRAALHPQRPALLTAHGTWSFSALDAWAWVVAQRLMALGCAAGERVALLAHNSAAYAAVLHATPRARVVLVPLNTRLSAAELAWQLADCGAHLLLYDEAHGHVAQTLQVPLRAALEDVCALSPLPKHWPSCAQRMGDGDAPDGHHPPAPSPALRERGGTCCDAWDVNALPTERSTGFLPADEPVTRKGHPSHSPTINLDALHTIIYTSGTTGRPKGAMLTAGNHWWSATASLLNLGLRDDDRWLALLPLFHVGGLSILLRGAIYGMPVVLHERFAPEAALAAIEHDGVTIASLVAVMLARMLDAAGERPLPPHFRCALLGGGPAPRPLLEACAARGVPVVQTYGMTESASQAVTLSPTEALRKLGSAGQPLLPLELRIIHEGQTVPPGDVGEICLRGPMLTSGYYQRPEATAAALRDGWLHTGDLGYCDAEGFLYVVDRRDDLIISGGENVYPAEIEAVLLGHPAVAEAGVIGIEDAQWGAVPVAFVVCKTNAIPNAAELHAHCCEQLAAYKVPRAIHFVASLPRTAAGKLQRRLLRG